jgi:predicted ATPase
MTENTFSQWLALRSFKGFFKDLKILKQNNYLSSGQKRILGMFSTLMVLRPGSTVLIDEPELSLHIDWQRNLISALIDGFQHLTFVFATHSPDVIMNHPEKVIAVPPSEKV